MYRDVFLNNLWTSDNATRDHAIPHYAISCNTMQYHTILFNTRERKKKRTCSSVINFSATLGSWFGVAFDPWWLAWLVAGHEGCRAPQNAAAGFPPIESIMFEPCTCIIVHIDSLKLFSTLHKSLILTCWRPDQRFF